MEDSNIQEYDGILLCMSQLTSPATTDDSSDFPALRIPVFEILSQFTVQIVWFKVGGWFEQKQRYS